jgi:oxygen-independent coproporphyrinogen-3 oxidase
VLPDDTRQWEFFQLTSDYLQQAGYIHYEVSNFARGEAFVSRHNRKYWDRTPYLGLGPSAHSYFQRRRWWNHASLDRYLSALASGRLPVSGEETLTNDQMRLEDLFLGLRTRKGIDFKTFIDRYGYDLQDRRKEMIADMVREGCLTLDGYGIRPTLKGLALADRLAVMLNDGDRFEHRHAGPRT